MNDYEKAIDILESVDTGIQGAKAIEMLKSALTELADIMKRAEEKQDGLELISRIGFRNTTYSVKEVKQIIDFIIKGEGE